MEAGTVILFFYSPDKVIFAADSCQTTIRSGANVGYRDDECKLLALDEHFIAGFGGLSKGVRFTSRDIAKHEFKKLRKHEPDLIQLLADAWANQMKVRLDDALKDDPSVINATVDVGRILSGAAFAEISKAV